jgi:NADPH-dependent 2,4-dienoyl-CoA reductase/sulfur reductase-like enzyme
VEVKDWVTGQQTLIPLAGPANRQGRIAADNIAGRSSSFRGSQGSSVVGLFGLTLAGTGEPALANRICCDVSPLLASRWPLIGVPTPV